MNKIIRLVRYDWPLFFVLLMTNWLPDNVIFLRLRGFLSRPFFASCGHNFRLSRNLLFYNPSKIHIGNDVYIAYGSWFSADAKLFINDEVTIGPYCVITTSNHQRIEGTFFNSGSSSADVQVGKGCWLGAHCVVTAGSIIGAGSVLGAGAVCTGTIPEAVLAGGVPARVIKQLDGANR